MCCALKCQKRKLIPTYKDTNFHMSIHLKISVLCSVLTNTDQSIPLCCQNVSWCLAGWLGLTKGRRNVKKMVGRGVPFKIWQKIQVLLKQKVKSIQKTLIGHKKNQTWFFFCPHQFERSSTGPELTEYSLTVTQLSIVYL